LLDRKAARRELLSLYRVQASATDTPLSWVRRFSGFLGLYSNLAPVSSNFSSVSTRHLYFCFLSIKESRFCKLIHQIVNCLSAGNSFITKFVEIFANTFQQIRVSRRCHTEIHAALKYTSTWRNTLLTNCNWEKTANGADNCRPLLKNHNNFPRVNRIVRRET
jgi:hypothetical protein